MASEFLTVQGFTRSRYFRRAVAFKMVTLQQWLAPRAMGRSLAKSNVSSCCAQGVIQPSVFTAGPNDAV